MSNEMSKAIGMKIGIQGNLFQTSQALSRARTQAQQNVCFRGITTDSRQIQPGQLFVALRGEKFDGHAYVADVLARGAVAVIIDEQGAADWQAQGVRIQPALIVAVAICVARDWGDWQQWQNHRQGNARQYSCCRVWRSAAPCNPG